MQVVGLGWLGIRSSADHALSEMLVDVLGLQAQHPEPGMTMFDLPDGSQVEVFSTGYAGKQHFTTGPVAGFWVQDLPAATVELVGRGIPLLGEPGPLWQHFRAPDGHVFELKER